MEVKDFKARKKIVEGKLEDSETRVQDMTEEENSKRARRDESATTLDVRLKSEEQ